MENQTTIYSSYTEAQKRATKKYRENNKDKVNLQRKKYYEERKAKDPTFLEQKRNKAKEYYLKKKEVNKIDKKDDSSNTSTETNSETENEKNNKKGHNSDKENSKPKKQTKKAKGKDRIEIIYDQEPECNIVITKEKPEEEQPPFKHLEVKKEFTEEELFKFYSNFKVKPEEEKVDKPEEEKVDKPEDEKVDKPEDEKKDIKDDWIEVKKKKERKPKEKTNLKKEDLLVLELKPLEEEVIEIPEILKTPKTLKGRKVKKI